MPEQDFRTILDGEIFLARTSYFEILEALPLELRRDFEFAELSNRAQSPFDRLFRDKLERLMQFVEDRVLVAGRLLIELANAIDVNVLESDSMSPIVHAFCDDGAEAPGKTHLPDRIRLQASRFAEYFAITGASPSSVGSVEESRALVELALALRTRSQLPREDVFERAFEQFA